MNPLLELSEIIKEDFLGNVVARGKKAAKPYEEIIKTEYEDIDKIMSEAQQNPELLIVLQNIDRDTSLDKEEKVKETAEALGVSSQRWGEFYDILEQKTKTIGATIDYASLDALWEELLPKSAVQVIDSQTFPKDTAEFPFIVFYSADWCNPCKLRKPTYAMLSRFFVRAQLFYTSDEDLANRELDEVRFPTLVAYFPDKETKVKSSLPLTTYEFWNTLNKLITFGSGFEGEGQLICTETECSIEPI